MINILRIRIGSALILPVLVVLFWDYPAVLIVKSALSGSTLDDDWSILESGICDEADEFGHDSIILIVAPVITIFSIYSGKIRR